MQEKGTLVDSIEVCLRDKDGNIKSKHIINNGFWNRLLRKLGLKYNSMTNIGFAQTAAWLLKDIDADHLTYANCDWIGIGTNNTAAGATDTNLLAQVSRLAGVGTREQTTVANDTAQLVTTFSKANDAGLTGTMTIVEIAMFWASTGATAILRQVYSPGDVCNWDAGDTLQVTVKVQIKQGA